ncbi:MAG: hypothetical protein J6X94_00830 [Lachnospiraceae bacterium]|nr:hypothetical protein [Lachnospiraceae bacterium]
MKLRMIITAAIFLILLSSCSSKDGRENMSVKDIEREPKEHKLMELASPGTSAMSIYRYDGQNCIKRLVFDKDWEQELIDEVNSIELKTADETELYGWGEPCYGIAIGGTDGMEIWLAYHEGLWLEKGGAVYYGMCDLEKYFDKAANLKDTKETSFDWGALPNNAILKKYDLKYCRKATGDVYHENAGISLDFVSFKDNVVTLEYHNNSDKSFEYGAGFELQERINGEWYVISPLLSNYGFNALAYLLPSGKEVQVACYLEMYGELGKGHYRIVKEELGAEFDVE